MALNQRFLQLMVWLKSEGHVAGRNVIEIGAQQLNDGFLKSTADIAQLCGLFGVAVPPLPPPQGAESDSRLVPAAPFARAFYEALGFEYSCIDVDNTPGAIPLDLNFENLPLHLRGRFDLITNFGTTEHIANQLNAFKIIHELAAPGAIMIHELPTLGELNHGLINYQPKFFERLARGNAYDTLFFDFHWQPVAFGLPDDLESMMFRFVNLRGRPQYGVSASAITTVMRKTADAPFVPPLDIPGSAAVLESPPDDPLTLPSRFERATVAAGRRVLKFFRR
jgi:hypothetical protein